MMERINLYGVTFLLDGDVDAARARMHSAYLMLYQAKMINTQKLGIISNKRDFRDGSKCKVLSQHGLDSIYIYVPPIPVGKKVEKQFEYVQEYLPYLYMRKSEFGRSGVMVCRGGLSFEGGFEFYSPYGEEAAWSTYYPPRTYEDRDVDYQIKDVYDATYAEIPEKPVALDEQPWWGGNSWCPAEWESYDAYISAGSPVNSLYLRTEYSESETETSSTIMAQSDDKYYIGGACAYLRAYRSQGSSDTNEYLQFGEGDSLRLKTGFSKYRHDALGPEFPDPFDHAIGHWWYWASIGASILNERTGELEPVPDYSNCRFYSGLMGTIMFTPFTVSESEWVKYYGHGEAIDPHNTSKYAVVYTEVSGSKRGCVVWGGDDYTLYDTLVDQDIPGAPETTYTQTEKVYFMGLGHEKLLWERTTNDSHTEVVSAVVRLYKTSRGYLCIFTVVILGEKAFIGAATDAGSFVLHDVTAGFDINGENKEILSKNNYATWPGYVKRQEYKEVVR